MFDIGFSELLIILLIIMVLWGGKKLPEFAQNLGDAVRIFKSSFESKPKTKAKSK